MEGHHYYLNNDTIYMNNMLDHKKQEYYIVDMQRINMCQNLSMLDVAEI